jgi:hypothetical protein
MTRASWIAGAFVLAMVSAVMIHWYLLDGISGVFWSLCFREDTEYAVGYSDARFREVEIGMTENDVTQLLGAPLETRSLENDMESWRYSRSPTDTSYRIRSVLFERGRVEAIYHEFYVD